MGDYIKTGLEIEAKLSSYENFKTEREYCDFEDSIWVSLDWLKEKLDMYASSQVLEILNKEERRG